MSEMPDEKPVNTDVNSDENKNQTNTDNASANSENMIPQSRFNTVNEQRKSALAELKAVADELEKDVPEDMQDLIPDILPAQKITWIRQAIKKGIFNTKIENGLDSKRPKGGKPPLDTSKMSPMEMMSHGYK